MKEKGNLDIIDSTLRDGEQAPGAVFSLKEKMHICEMLDKIGIPEVELETPAMSDSDVKEIRTIVDQQMSFRSLVWSRFCKKDIDAAVKTHAKGIHISLPVSSVHLGAMGKDKEWVRVNLRNAVNYARDYFEYVTIGAQDASRADMVSWKVI